MANDNFSGTGFVVSVDPGEEATVEPIKEDLNFLHGKFDSVTGHKHNAEPGQGPYVSASTAIEMIMTEPVDLLPVWDIPQTIDCAFSQFNAHYGSWTTIYSKKFLRLEKYVNKYIYVDITFILSLFQDVHPTAILYAVFEYEKNDGSWQALHSVISLSGRFYEEVSQMYRCNGRLLFSNGKTPFHLRCRVCMNDPYYVDWARFSIAHKSLIIVWE